MPFIEAHSYTGRLDEVIKLAGVILTADTSSGAYQVPAALCGLENRFKDPQTALNNAQDVQNFANCVDAHVLCSPQH